MKRRLRPKDRLYIYECRGLDYGEKGPEAEGFLGGWPEPPYLYLFFNRPALAEVRRWLQSLSRGELTQSLEMNYEEWQQISPRDQQVGSFLIRTEDSLLDTAAGAAGSEAMVLKLRRGLTFGSGLHPSTRGCLLALEEIERRGPFHTAVDLGTGTGILAMACIHLGASRVLALDCNFLAVQEARSNFNLNGMESRVHSFAADRLESVKPTADLLLMNLEWPCLGRILEASSWRRFPRAVLSGFLESQQEDLTALLPRDYKPIHRRILDGWATWIVERG